MNNQSGDNGNRPPWRALGAAKWYRTWTKLRAAFAAWAGKRPRARRAAKYVGFGLGGVLALFVLLVTALQVPPLASLVVAAAIDAAGYGPAKIEGAHVGLTGARIAVGAIGKPGADVRFEELSATYDFPAVLGGRVNAVHAKWLFAKASFENGKLNLPLINPRPASAKAKVSQPLTLPTVEIDELWAQVSGFDASLAAAGNLTLAPAGRIEESYDLNFKGTIGSNATILPGELRFSLRPGRRSATWQFAAGAGQLPAALANLTNDRVHATKSIGSISFAGEALESINAEVELADRFDELRFENARATIDAYKGRAVVELAIEASPDQCREDLDQAKRNVSEILRASNFGAEMFELNAAHIGCSARAQALFAGLGKKLKFNRLDVDFFNGVAVPSGLYAASKSLDAFALRPATPSVVRVAVHLPRRMISADSNIDIGDAELTANSLRQFKLSETHVSWPAPDGSLAFEAGAINYDAAKGVGMGSAFLTLDGRLAQTTFRSFALALSGEVTKAGSVWQIVPTDGCVSTTFDSVAAYGLTAQGGGAKVCTSAGQPLAVLDIRGDQLLLAHGQYELAPRTAAISGTTFTGKFPQGAFKVSVGKGGEPIRLEAGVTAGPLTVRPGKDEGIGIASLTADSVIEIGAQGFTLNASQIAAQVIDGAKVPRFSPLNVAGALSAAGGKLQGTFTGNAFNQHLVSASLMHDLSIGAGTLSFDSGELKFASGGTPLQKLLPILFGKIISAQGTARAKGAFAWRPRTKLASSGAILLKGFGFTTQYGRLEGIDGDMTLANLMPPKTTAAQQFRITKMNVGLPLANGVLEINLPGDGSVQLPSAVWPWAGGELAIEGGAFIPGAAVQHLAMTVQTIDLTALFKLVQVDGLAGSGVVDGRLPIEVRGKDAFLVGGNVKARGPGVLSYTGKDLPSSNDKGASLLFTALQDFHYQTLEATIDGPISGEITIGLHLKGSNPKLYDGYPFALNISLKSALANLLLDTTKGLRIPQEINGQLRGAP